MNNEDDRIFVKLKRQDTLDFLGESKDDSSLSKYDGEFELNESQTGPCQSDYNHFKDSALLNICSNVTLPIRDGSTKLTIEEVEKSGPMALYDEPAITRFRRSSGSISAGTVNNAHVRAVIQRRQQRRNLKGFRTRDLKCLRFVLNILYYIGLSPYRPKTSWTPPKALVKVLKLAHWAFVAIAILESVAKLKMEWIKFRKEPKLLTIAETGICVILVITRLYTVKVMASMSQKMDRLLEWQSSGGRDSPITKCRKLEAVFGVVLTLSICMSVSSIVFGTLPFKMWSFSLQQKVVAYETNECIAVWSPNNWKNVTDELISQYTDGVTTPMILFGLIGNTIRYVGTLYDNLTVDFWLALSYQIYSLHRDLAELLNMAAPFPTQVEFDMGWNMYMESSFACDQIDGIFGRLMKLVHVTNILRFSDFLVDVMRYEASGFRVTCLIVLLKICVTYTICLWSADTNGKMHEHVIHRADSNGCILVNGKKWKVYAVRMEMDLHPVGVGRGNFLVEETFLLKMLCAAWSLFALIADHSTDDLL